MKRKVRCIVRLGPAAWWPRAMGPVPGLLLAFGCLSVRLVGDYDPIVDQKVTELHAETTAFFTQLYGAVPVDSTFYPAHRGFFDAARATIQALTVRAEVLEEGLHLTPLSDNIRHLQGLFDELERGVKPDENGRIRLRPRPVINSAEAALNQGFRAIITHLVFLRKKTGGS